MKKTIFLIPFIVALSFLMVNFASANLASIDNTEFNGVDLAENGNPFVGLTGETVPVRVTFTANDNVSDVRLKLRMEGHREDVSASTSRFDVIDGNTYTKLLNLRLPSDLDELSEDFTLYVEVVSSTQREEAEYTIAVQRESYTLEVLSVDYSTSVRAGEILPISVVASNNGFNVAEDNYVSVSIPSLGVAARGYVGDLDPFEDYREERHDHEEDTLEEIVYLKIPANAESGIYEMEIELYNDDSSVRVTKLISIGSGSFSAKVLSSVVSQEVKAGNSATYDLILVNSEDDLKIFNIAANSDSGLKLSFPAVVTVGPKSSETVSVKVQALANAEEGSHAFSVNVNGEELVFNAIVVGAESSASVVALTVILVIIFIVLLAVLITLLARKGKSIEEVETSYY